MLGFLQVMYPRLQLVADIYAVPTADAVVTGKANCYSCIVRQLNKDDTLV